MCRLPSHRSAERQDRDGRQWRREGWTYSDAARGNNAAESQQARREAVERCAHCWNTFAWPRQLGLRCLRCGQRALLTQADDGVEVRFVLHRPGPLPRDLADAAAQWLRAAGATPAMLTKAAVQARGDTRRVIVPGLRLPARLAERVGENRP